MRKVILLGLIGLLVAGSWMGVYPSSVQAADPYEFVGGGTPGDPYMVLTAEDMDHVRDYLDASYRQGADIDLSDFATGSGWEPIGTQDFPFTGTFDGNHYTLSGLYINSSSNHVGLFGYTRDSTLNNIRLVNVDVTGDIFVGGLVGMAFSTGVMESSVSSVSGSVYGNYNAGGLAGYLVGPGAIIRNSFAAVDVSGDRYIGGLLGMMDSQTDGIMGSYASGDVTGSSFVGGLVGDSRGSVQDSYATGNVHATTYYAAGLIYYVGSGVTIHGSFQTGAVTAGDSSRSGVLLGVVNLLGGVTTVTDLRYNMTLNPSWPAIGFDDPGSGHQGMSDEDMKTALKYGAGFDFTTVGAVWGIQEGISYPYLRAFKPSVTVDALQQATYRLDSLMNVNGYMIDGSMGEPVRVDYEILDSSNHVVTSRSQAFLAATGVNQGFSFTETLNDARFPEGTYTVNVTAEDDEGHLAPIRSVTFIVDHTPPVITLNGTNPMDVAWGSTYNEPGATALDAVDGDLTTDITVSGAVDTNQVGSYTITYEVADAAGNVATETRTVRVVSSGGGSGGGSPIVKGSNNANLAQLSLLIDGSTRELTPAFAPGITEYTMETDREQIELQLSTADSKAVVKVLNKLAADRISIPLVVGTQTVEITVQAEDGTLKIYNLTITRLADQVIVPPVSECAFTDIQGHWARADICEAAGLRIVEGVSANIFAPDKAVTRTEFAAMLLRTLQIPIMEQSSANPYSDKESIPDWARLAIHTGAAQGILQGYPDGTFRPLQGINRAEMAVMLAKALKWETNSELDLIFSDGASIPTWAQSYVKVVHAKGLLQGRGGNQFAPLGMTTRAEAAVVMLRLWKSLEGSR